MNQYLLSTFMLGGEVPGAPSSPEEMQEFMGRVMALEAAMDEEGVFVFGGALLGPETAAVLTAPDAGFADGPFLEANGHLAGFYIINAEDEESARAWAEKVVAAVNHPIEVRPFRATGRVADHMGDMS